MNEFSSLVQEFTELERKAIEQAAYGRGQFSLPDDWDSTRAKRLKKAEKDFFYFCEAYFPKWFTAPFGKLHRDMLNAAMSNDRSVHFFAAHREGGKTVFFRAFKVWCACFGKKQLYSKSSDTIDLVLKDFRYVRGVIKYNSKIASDFPNIIDDTWDTMHSFRVRPHKHNATGTTFIANSSTVTPRGEVDENAQRVDFIEGDDWEDYSTSISPDQSRFKIDVIERDYQPALSEKGCAVFLGNNSRTTCMLNILLQMPKADLSANHPAFVLHEVPAWDDRNNRATWYERWDYASEEEMRLALKVSKSVWNGEYQQKPTPPEGERFLLKHWNTFVLKGDEPMNGKSIIVSRRELVGVMFCDPAFGETSDFKVWIVMLYSPIVKKFLVVECFVRRCDWEEYFLSMYGVFDRWRAYLKFIGWESNFAQAKYLQFREAYQSTRKLPQLPIREIKVEGDKFFRIEQIEDPFTLGSILFHENFAKTADGIEAQSQLIGYQGKKTAKLRVDFPDCLASAYKECWPMAVSSSGGIQGDIDSGGERHFSARF